MFNEMLVAGGLSAIGFIIIALKFNRTWLRRILGYDIFFDILITLSFMAFMAGTYAGAMAAIISGICVSLVLFLTKHIVGYEKLVYEDGDLFWKRIK